MGDTCVTTGAAFGLMVACRNSSLWVSADSGNDLSTSDDDGGIEDESEGEEDHCSEGVCVTVLKGSQPFDGSETVEAGEVGCVNMWSIDGSGV